VWGHTPPPSPACMLKKALDFVCAFINKWVWLCKGCFSRRLTEMSRNAKTKTKNINAQCFYNLHNLCHKPSSFIHRCSSYMAKHIKSSRPRFLSTLIRVICFARMTHEFLLNCPKHWIEVNYDLQIMTNYIF
jgi:hypothetical protein